MHALQPMQMRLSKSTMPSGRWNMAEVGHAATHGACAHWLQRVTWCARRACGHTPTSTCLTYVRVTPSGTRFSDLQAVVQAWQPMQRVWSMTLAHRAAGAAESSCINPSPSAARARRKWFFFLTRMKYALAAVRQRFYTLKQGKVNRTPVQNRERWRAGRGPRYADHRRGAHPLATARGSV